MTLFCFIADVGSQPEALNKKAIAIVNRVKDKLTGIFIKKCLKTSPCLLYITILVGHSGGVYPLPQTAH